jgi:predicted nucleotidyltransferase
MLKNSFISLPEDREKRVTLEGIVNDLQKIKGVLAIVLGGSYAAGAAKKTSDLDIGIYYTQKDPFSIADIKAIANKYSVANNLTVTDFYEWGLG